jgi:hypothetical protein
MDTWEETRQRRLRLLEDFQSVRLEEFYLLYEKNAQFRDDLESEAASGETDPANSLLTPEILKDMRKLVETQIESTGCHHEAEWADAYGPMGTVVLVPGCMASTLSDRKTYGWLWVNIFALASGLAPELALCAYDGTEIDKDYKNVEIHAISPIWILYLQLIWRLRLARFSTQVFPVDWRKETDFSSVAISLKDTLCGLTSKGPVHIIAHSGGAHVARRALQMLNADPCGVAARPKIYNLILLGPANFGTFMSVLALGGSLHEIPVLKSLVPANLPPDVMSAIWSMSFLYQIVPWDKNRTKWLKKNNPADPAFWQGIDNTRLAKFYPCWGPTLDSSFFNCRTTVILGDNGTTLKPKKTTGGVKFDPITGKMKIDARYNEAGDGFVTHNCSKLDGTKCHVFKNTEHVKLAMYPRVLNKIVSILTSGPVAPFPCPKAAPRARKRAH